MPGGEATNVNVVVFGLIRSRLDLTIYRTRGELTNHYTIDVSNRDTDIQYINVLKGITDPHLYFTCKSENEKRLSIVSCKFKTNSLSNYLHTNTSSNAIVNAASNISYRTLLEASDTRSMLPADVGGLWYKVDVTGRCFCSSIYERG